MRAFLYVLDPLCLAACLGYALNRLIVEPHTTSAFLHGTFNDLLLIPAALPPVLWLQRRLGWRTHDRPPTPGEIMGHILVWAVVCEGIGPLLLARAVADWWDIAAYAAGALIAGLWWNRARGDSGFDLLAAHYDWMESLLAGRKLAICRDAFLEDLSSVRHALLAGEGHGRFLVSLLQRHPGIQVTCVDTSERMMETARARMIRGQLQGERVVFVRENVLEWNAPAAAYDLIATHFFLDCFTANQLALLIPRLAHSARPGARWLVADFQIPARGKFRRLRARIIHWLMYRFFRVITRLPAAFLVPPARLLAQEGFSLRQHREFDRGLLYAESWEKTVLQTSAPASAILQ